MMRMHTEKENLQQLIDDVESEKLSMKNKLMQLEVDSHELKHENRRLSENLESALSEKQQLERRIHNLHMQFVKGSSAKVLENPMIEENAKQSTKQSSRVKVASILKETNLLELQGKLLLYLKENEVLHAKLWHYEQCLSARQTEWKKSEFNLSQQVRQLVVANEELQIKHGENKLELTAAQAKVRMLEKVLGAVTQENKDILHPECIATRYGAMQKGAFSLPPTLLNHIGEKHCKHYCREIKPFPNNCTYLDISLLPSSTTEPLGLTDESGNCSHYISADLIEETEHRSSTPLPMGDGWECYNNQSPLKNMDKLNLSQIQAEPYTDKSNCITEISVFENSTTDFYQSLPHNNSSNQKFCNSFFDENIINGSFTRRSNNCATGGDSVSKMQSCNLVSSLSDSSNANTTSTVCQIDGWLMSEPSQKLDAKPKKFQNVTTGLDLSTQTKNSADIRQQIQDILDRITATADEALV